MLIGTPENLHCEAKACRKPATHIYGPECEAETGKLMYVCEAHTEALKAWMQKHANDPVNCPTHGNIGPVKSYVILRSL